MKIGVIGCGFWAGYQVAAWREADPSLEFAFCDTVPGRAQALAENFGGADACYHSASHMLGTAKPDVVDIISSPETHAEMILLAARRGLPVICQKPMTTDWDIALRMVEYCEMKKVPFFIHENFRWQTPIRALKTLFDSGRIGVPFRSRIYFNSAFPVFENQPFLAKLDKMMVADVGVHLLDVCRFLFGEVRTIYAVNQRINPDIRGEDVSTLLLQMENGMTCTIEMSYASVVDYDCFPQTLAEVEGDKGSVSLHKDYRLKYFSRETTEEWQVELPNYEWVHPQYAVVQTAMVAIHRHFLAALRGELEVETSGTDNLKTLRLTYAAYESAASGKVVEIQ